MNKAQDGRYWSEWSKAKKVLQGAGFDAADCEEKRQEITKQVGAISHVKFTNAQLTRAIAAFRAISNPDFQEQMEMEQTANAQDDPAQRCAFRISKALDAIAPRNRTAYEAAVCRSLGIPEIPAHRDWREFQSLARALERNAKRIK